MTDLLSSRAGIIETPEELSNQIAFLPVALGVPLRLLVPALWATLWTARVMPWPTLTRLLTGTMVKMLDPQGKDEPFWRGYCEELFSSRLRKPDIISTVKIPLECHQRFHFTPSDLEN
ncbi:MAG: hypothetical protein WBN92_14115 [Terriglobia bacterium]